MDGEEVIQAEAVDEEEVIQVRYYIKLYLSYGGLALVIVALFAFSFIMGMDTALLGAFGAVGDKTILTLHSDLRQRDPLPLSKIFVGQFYARAGRLSSLAPPRAP